MRGNLADALIRLQADLRAIQARWALVGGLAVSARAEPRTTRDIDFTIAVAGDREAEAVARLLIARGYRIDTHLEQEQADRLATVRFLTPAETPGILADALFASSGIEREVTAEADLLEVLPGFFAPVAKTGHLLALKCSHCVRRTLRSVRKTRQTSGNFFGWRIKRRSSEPGMRWT